MVDVSSTKFQQDEKPPVSSSMPIYTCPDWGYKMRRNMQEIVPGVFLGPFCSAQKACSKILYDSGITHIICVRQDIEAHYIRPQMDEFKYIVIDIADKPTENIIKHFPEVKEFIDGALSRNGKVLVHGNNGISRSATLVIAYIMEKYGLTTKEAIDCVKKHRGCIHPNEGFMAQLFEFEPIYRARQTLERGESSNEHRHLKRKSEHLCESVDYDLIQPPPSPISDYNNDTNCQPSSDFSNHLYRLWLLKRT